MVFDIKYSILRPLWHCKEEASSTTDYARRNAINALRYIMSFLTSACWRTPVTNYLIIRLNRLVMFCIENYFGTETSIFSTFVPFHQLFFWFWLPGFIPFWPSFDHRLPTVWTQKKLLCVFEADLSSQKVWKVLLLSISLN